MSLPTITVIGNVKKPELRYSQSGTAIHNFTLEASEKDKDGNWKNLYIKVTTFAKTAEFVNQYFNEGDVAVVTGKLITTSWQDKEGKKHFETTFEFPSVTFPPKAKGRSQEQSYEKHAPAKMPKSSLPEIDVDESEIPF